MKKHLLLLFIFAFGMGLYGKSVKAQTIELLAGNTLNGAMNGVILGGATMALQNPDEIDFEPARIGLGAGTLYGIGVGINDIVQTPPGQKFYISGTFNDATNTSVLVLLDTIYGAAGGAIVASSISLIIKAPLGTALQYGAGSGAWLGFGFGLVDAFALAEGPGYSQQTLLQQRSVEGLLTYSSSSNNVEVGMISPDFFSQKKLTSTNLTTTVRPSLKVVDISVRF